MRHRVFENITLVAGSLGAVVLMVCCAWFLNDLSQHVFTWPLFIGFIISGLFCALMMRLYESSWGESDEA
jgi:ABC-type Mn2+/Zn2+ transport system permease subunit